MLPCQKGYIWFGKFFAADTLPDTTTKGFTSPPMIKLGTFCFLHFCTWLDTNREKKNKSKQVLLVVNWTCSPFTCSSGVLGPGSRKLQQHWHSDGVTGGAETPNGSLEYCDCLRHQIVTLTQIRWVEVEVVVTQVNKYENNHVSSVLM